MQVLGVCVPLVLVLVIGPVGVGFCVDRMEDPLDMPTEIGGVSRIVWIMWCIRLQNISSGDGVCDASVYGCGWGSVLC